MSSNKFFALIMSLTLLLLSCSNNPNNDQTIQGGGSSLMCSATGTLGSGDINASFGTVSISSFSVSMYNGTGPFTIALPNGTSATANSAFYTHPSSLNVTTISGGGVSSPVSVYDSTSRQTAYCTLIIPRTSGGGSSTNGVITLTASPSTSAVKGSSISLTATATSVSNPIFSFSHTESYPSYVAIQNVSNGVANVTSTIAQTVNVTVTMISNSSGAASSSHQVALTFTESGSSGTASVTLSASPSSSVSLGTTATISSSVSGISDPVYTWSWSNNSIGASGSSIGGTAYVSSSTSGTATLALTVTSAANSSLTANSQITLTFGSGGSTPTTMTCTLTHNSGVYYRNQNIPFFVIASTGEALRLSYLDLGEAWDNGSPSFPMSLSRAGNYNYFYANYRYAGTKTITAIAESVSRPGVYCNSGAAMNDSISIY